MTIDIKSLGDKAKGFLKTAGDKVVSTATEVRKKADQAAEVVAVKVTELTGRETTATEVKQATAVVAGAVLLATTAVAVMRSQQSPALSGGLDSGWGSDFESKTAQAFAENGYSLNYYTPKIDSAGTINYDPNG